MAEDPQTGLDPAEDPGDPKDTNEDTGPGSQQDPGASAEDSDTEDPKGKPNPELAKAIKARDAAKEKARQQADRIRELEERLNPEKKDPVAAANRKLVTAEARVVLTGQGLKDPADQRAVLGFLKLDDVAVSGDGEVDADAITEQVETLLAVAKKLAGGKQGPRSPRLDTRDMGGEKAKPVDAAKARRLSMLR